jgi:hypothetical protein
MMRCWMAVLMILPLAGIAHAFPPADGDVRVLEP